MTTWTDKQLLTIDTRDRSVLVSAAAGSGKTAVLTERILKLVTEEENRVQLKELLVVTFTEAAASEMKSRIAAALTEASETDPFAEAQLRQLGSAKIMTFHAFCLTVLRRYFYVIELDPSFAVADDKRAAALREDALDEVFAAAFRDNDASFTDFLRCYAGARDERKAREKVLEVFDFIMTLPEPFAWLDKHVSALFMTKGKAPLSPAVLYANEEIAYRLKLASFLTEQTGALLSSRGLSGLAAKNMIDLETVTGIERIFRAGDTDATRIAIQELSFERFNATKDEKEEYEGIKALITKRRDRVKNILKKEIGEVFFARPSEEYADEIIHTAPYARTLETLVRRFAEAYTRIKRSENVIDFTDFEHMALMVLEDDSIADDYRRRFSHVFIDEYQDSNYVQEALISRVSRKDNLFMVGDVKQSIYSFRNAVPAIFLDKFSRYPTEKAEGCAEIRIDLSKNFRSKDSVIDAANAVFETVMESHYSGMDYDENARLDRGISYEPVWEGRTCLHLIKRDAESNTHESEAVYCAKIIKDTIGKDFYDSKKKNIRPIGYGDIVILMRSAKGVAEVFRSVLEKSGIPAMTDRGEGYFETVEIDTFLGMLRAIVNLRRDVPLAAAMCSAVLGFDLSELAEIRAAGREGFFYTAFLAYAESGANEELRKKCAAAAERLARWRDEERFMRLDDFLWKLMRESGFYGYISALPRGEQRKANLRALLDRAADYQSGRVDGLRGFLSFLDRIKLRGGVEQANLIMDGEDVCRIMTIHGSKGREFPVVLITGLGRSLSAGGNNDDSLLIHRDVGLSLRWVDSEAHTHKKTLLHSALKLRQDIDERAENIRLLYVGMTRAMDTLHMVGTAGSPEKLIELYKTEGTDPEVDTDILGAANYLQLILPTAVNRKGIFDIELVDGEIIVAGTEASRDLVGGEKDKPAGSPRLPAADKQFSYPYAAAAGLKSKYSVTELSKAPGSEVPVFFIAGSADEETEDAGLTAAERGTELHKALEQLDFREAYAHRDDESWFENEALHRFANSDLLARAAASDFLMKEAPFNMKLPYGETSRGKDDNEASLEEVVVQGVIDCLFSEGDGLVIADYKTGWFDAKEYDSEAERIRSAYGEQLRLYRRAAELIFEKPVSECLIYMTAAGVTVDI